MGVSKTKLTVLNPFRGLRGAMKDVFTQKNISATAIKKALIIDDEPIINRLNKKILNGIDIESDCKSSLDFLKNEKVSLLSSYDIVIIDLNLLRRSGEKILEKIKNIKEKLPVLITSGYLKESASDYLQKYHPISYIQKPYTMEDFIAQVKNLLEA